jgi:hypothetical protein
VSSRLASLTARRIALQGACARQRADASEAYREIAGGAERADRLLDVARRLTPVLAVAGVAALVALGPARTFALARRALTIAIYVRQARAVLG